MSWKYRAGQIVGIIIGVTTGMFLVDTVIYKLRGSPEAPPSATLSQAQPYPNQQPLHAPQGSVFDQAVANIQSKPNTRSENTL